MCIILSQPEESLGIASNVFSEVYFYQTNGISRTHNATAAAAAAVCCHFFPVVHIVQKLKNMLPRLSIRYVQG